MTTGRDGRADLSSADAWEALCVGETLGPLAWTLPQEIRERQLDALACTHSWYRHTAPLGAPVILPVSFQELYYRLMDLRYDWPLAVAAKLEIGSHRAARVGETFWGVLRIVDRYVRRGGRYLVTETRVTDAAGEPVCTLRNWALLNPGDHYAQ